MRVPPTTQCGAFGGALPLYDMWRGAGTRKTVRRMWRSRPFMGWARRHIRARYAAGQTPLNARLPLTAATALDRGSPQPCLAPGRGNVPMIDAANYGSVYSEGSSRKDRWSFQMVRIRAAVGPKLGMRGLRSKVLDRFLASLAQIERARSKIWHHRMVWRGMGCFGRYVAATARHAAALAIRHTAGWC